VRVVRRGTDKSTLNRRELSLAEGITRYHKIRHRAEALERLFVHLFLEAHRKASARDRDAKQRYLQARRLSVIRDTMNQHRGPCTLCA
jgi:hypothetical protein